MGKIIIIYDICQNTKKKLLITPYKRLSQNETEIQKNLHCAVANSGNPATSKSSIMAAKTLQNHTKAATALSASTASAANSRTMASRPVQSSWPATNLRPQHNSRSTDSFLVYETVDKPAQVGQIFEFLHIFVLFFV